MSIQGLVYESRGVDHEDERRAILTAFNGGLEDFVAKQVKFAVMKIDSNLGGHYHPYRELFYLLDGNAKFDLKHVDSEEEEAYVLEKGDMLLIPKRVAHKAFITKGTTLVGCTEEPYISPDVNDVKYDF